MCEMFAVSASQPIAIEDVLHYATLLDEYGVAGFSWGVAWRTDSGEIKRYRAVEGIRRDTLATRTLAGVESTHFLVHLRRPSLMTTISFVNAQPYLADEQHVAFAHNGYFRKHREVRGRMQDKLVGTSDSEVGFRYYLERLQAGEDAGKALHTTRTDLDGDANIGVLLGDGSIHFYSGHHDNAVYSFRIDGNLFATTALHSGDRYVFESVFPRAEGIEQVESGTVWSR